MTRGMVWTALLGTLFIVLLLVLATIATSAARSPSSLGNSPVLHPCPTEDSDNCFWDAATRGNGTGTSFVVLNGRVIYMVTP